MRYELTFGVGLDKEGIELDAREVKAAEGQIITLAANLFGGCTLVPSRGAWVNEGVTVAEDGRILIIDADSGQMGQCAASINRIVSLIKSMLRQQSVHVVELGIIARNV
jgi:hypothetical protein